MLCTVGVNPYPSPISSDTSAEQESLARAKLLEADHPQRAIEAYAELIYSSDQKISSAASYRMGLIDAEQNGTSTALHYLKMAIEKGHIGAKCKLGEWYAKGEVVKQNSQEAVDLFQQALEEDQQNALTMEEYEAAGVTLAHGLPGRSATDVKNDLELALNFLGRAAAKGSFVALHEIGKIYAAQGDSVRAFHYFQIAVNASKEAGEPYLPAFYELGMCYKSEVTTIDNNKKISVEYTSSSKETGDRKSGSAPPLAPNFSELADSYISKAAEGDKPHPAALLYMGKACMAKIDFTKNAFDQSDSNNMTLVENYLKHKSLEKDKDALFALSQFYAAKAPGALNKAVIEKTALDYLWKAADAGHIEACLELACKLYDETNGNNSTSWISNTDTKNNRLDQAVTYFTKASDAGNAEASFRLGRIYATGEGNITQSDTTADKYFLRAIEQKHQGAATEHSAFLDRIEKESKIFYNRKEKLHEKRDAESKRNFNNHYVTGTPNATASDTFKKPLFGMSLFA